jgi:hypothetical protein
MFLAIKEDVLELIHRGAKGDYGVTKGTQWSGGSVMADHLDHIHVAMTKEAVEHYLGAKIPGAVGGLGGEMLVKTWRDDAEKEWSGLRGKYNDQADSLNGQLFGPFLSQMMTKVFPEPLFKHLDEKDPGQSVGGSTAGLTAASGSIMSQAFKQAKSMGASDKVLLALFEAGWVESNWRNDSSVRYVDHDSAGFLQQRPSTGWGTLEQVENVPYATRSFVSRAQAIENAFSNAGALAQAVQISAFPDKYHARRGDAVAALKKFDPKFDPATFDQGGWLRQGLTLAEHRPSQPDAVLTNKQWAAVTSIATEGAREVNIDAHVYVGDREITDIVRVEAKEVVKGNNQELTRNLTAKRRKR